MRHTSFVGALAAIGIGAVLAFAAQTSPSWIDLQEVGVILLLVGAAVLVIRTLVARSPRHGSPAGDVAAVVDPSEEPLDAVGDAVDPPPPAPEVPTPLDQWQRVDVGTAQARNRAGYERAMRAATEGGAVNAPDSTVAVTTITGRRIGPGARRAAKRARRHAR